MTKSNFKDAVAKSAKALWKSLPLILGTILLVSLISILIPKSFYTSVFSKNIFLDSFIGSIIGSISAGTPITSYIFGGEMLTQGVSLLAVTAFLVAWVTVGIIQLPAEIAILGKKFALLRNITSFILSIVVAIITILILGVFK
ncbi:permease [Candidatus Pacearchaeota archaeon]|nr:permease [Candidatus Pacearchaeota archaeon]